MSWLGGIEPGDHVVTREPVRSGWFDRIPAGRAGIVRETHRRMFSVRHTVEFVIGWRATTARDVSDGALRRTGLRGEAVWATRRGLRRAIKIGFLALMAPALISAALFILSGGDPGLRVHSVVVQMVDLTLQILLPLLPLAIVIRALSMMVRRK